MMRWLFWRCQEAAVMFKLQQALPSFDMGDYSLARALNDGLLDIKT